MLYHIIEILDEPSDFGTSLHNLHKNSQLTKWQIFLFITLFLWKSFGRVCRLQISSQMWLDWHKLFLAFHSTLLIVKDYFLITNFCLLRGMVSRNWRARRTRSYFILTEVEIEKSFWGIGIWLEEEKNFNLLNLKL